MTDKTFTTQDMLAALIAFPTVSADPNLDLITYCADHLEQAGADVTLIKDDTGNKANLFATIGPLDRPGVLLSGHTDVVSVVGQNWTVPPFELTQQGQKLFGRGTTDMKGFVASAMVMAMKSAKMDLETPLHLAFSYDEEIGCVGVRSLIDMLTASPFVPQLCIVGEPTMMQVATGHKGKTVVRVTTIGHASHSALAPTALNAIHMACDMIGFIRDLQAELAREGAKDTDYDVSCSTLHVGKIEGGVALNIVPDRTDFMFEIRNVIEDDPMQIMAKLEAQRDRYLQGIKQKFPSAKIDIKITNEYPPLSTPVDSEATQLVQSLAKTNRTIKVAFGTEGGLFSSKLKVPTVVCGPGSMDQGHKPDEFIEIDQLAACDAMLDGLLGRLVAGI